MLHCRYSIYTKYRESLHLQRATENSHHLSAPVSDLLNKSAKPLEALEACNQKKQQQVKLFNFHQWY